MLRKSDVEFHPAPARVVQEMLRLAEVGPADVVYDLGCGEGQIVIAAAERNGAFGVGVELDSALLEVARARAAATGVGPRVVWREEDFTVTEIRGATVITLYLLDSLNLRLRPRILAECAPGTRVVSYSFEMGDWEPDAHTPMAANGVSLWIVPAQLAGTWSTRSDSDGSLLESVTFTQHFQMLSGSAKRHGTAFPIHSGRISGSRFSFCIDALATPFSGLLDGEQLQLSGEDWTGIFHRVSST